MIHDHLIELKSVSKHFDSVIALENISLGVEKGKVNCLLGDNGAGKSTLIKILSGVHQQSKGEILFEGNPVLLRSPRSALELGIATVFQDLAMVSLMSITRNFFMGREPRKGYGPVRWIDFDYANEVTRTAMNKIGIDIRDPEQPVGTLSGGERQCLAIARAVHFGAKVLILDEPTSALGVAQASMVLRYIQQARENGLGVIFITHNVHHAYAIGDRFCMLNRGKLLGTFEKETTDKEEILEMMAGGRELQDLSSELQGQRI